MGALSAVYLGTVLVALPLTISLAARSDQSTLAVLASSRFGMLLLLFGTFLTLDVALTQRGFACQLPCWLP